MSTGGLLAPELFLPDPEPRPVRYTVISVDDHVVEPPDLFEGRMPAKLAGRAPRIVESPEGHEVWEFEGGRFTQAGSNAVAGRRPETRKLDPVRFSDMRPGCYDVEARVHDMDLNGVWASLNFPSQITGFCGRVYFNASDPELGLACVQAWNDWLFEEWYARYPERIVPLGITYLADPQVAAAEIRRNAARGFVAVSMPERPHMISPSIFRTEPAGSRNGALPSLWDTDHWDPIIQACVETDTVICLHVGSSGSYPMPPGLRAGPEGLPLGASLFGQLSLAASTEWLWSGYPARYPSLKIAMSEGGIGWVAMLLDRLDNLYDRSGYAQVWDERPADVFRRNFWFCTLDDPSTIETRHAIGVENIMVEVDYPHGDGTWPDTQLVIEQCWGHIPPDELRMMCSQNAAALFRHPLPDPVLPIGG